MSGVSPHPVASPGLRPDLTTHQSIWIKEASKSLQKSFPSTCCMVGRPDPTGTVVATTGHGSLTVRFPESHAYTRLLGACGHDKFVCRTLCIATRCARHHQCQLLDTSMA
jgi:hypothetical protein